MRRLRVLLVFPGEETCNGIYNGFLLCFGYCRKYGEGQNFPARSFSLWERTRSVTKVSRRRLQVKWERIVDFSWNSGIAQVVTNFVAPWSADHELVVHMDQTLGLDG